MQNRKRIAVLAATGAVLAGGAGVAVATTTKGGAQEHEQAVIDDAAKRLKVTPQQLRDALGAAEDAQIDQAVKDGRLTQQQADELKQRRAQSGRVLGGGIGHGRPGRWGGPRGGFGFFRGALGDVADDVAKALGLTRDQLFQHLRDGQSLQDVAKAQNRSVDDVKAAVRTAVKARLDQAVKDGRLSQDRADAIARELDEHLDDLVAGDFRGPFGRHR